ncbi:MAG: ABC transporter ATP-binding protein [Propioniciclava sp.]
MTALSVAGVDCAYLRSEDPEPEDLAEAVVALTDITHDFPRGSATLITGPSGCGKSTLLRLLNGLIPHVTPAQVAGTVTIDGLDALATDLTELGQRTATIFQNPRNQFFAATVAEELAFARQQAGEPRDQILQAIGAAADRIGISAWLPRGLQSMSGGELQRVACGTALASPASIFLFDEPTSNLSPEAIDEITEILAVMKAAGATLVIAEHRIYYLRGLVDTVITMTDGTVERVWTAAEFFALSDVERRTRGLRTLTRPTLELAPRATATDEGASGLTIRDFRFSYGSRRVLDIDSLAFPAGQVSAILGPNGVGKTTLCRVIVGLASPEKGGVIAWNARRASKRQRQATSSLVMQDVHRQLFSGSVLDEVRTGTKSRADIDVPALLDQLELGALADRHPMSLSGGQKQRLVIASVIADDARVVVFDEPTSGVDHRHLTEIAARIRDVASRGVAVIVVSHDIEFVSACADRLVHLGAPNNAGRSPVSVTEHPLAHEGAP